MKYGVRDNVITYYDDEGKLLPFTPYGKPQKQPDPPIKTMLTPEEKAELYGNAKRLTEWKTTFEIKPEPIKPRLKTWALIGMAGTVLICISAFVGFHVVDIFFDNLKL